jgi:hypothetical protein
MQKEYDFDLGRHAVVGKINSIRMLVRVSIAISGCWISNDCPLDMVSLTGLNGRVASISRKVCTVAQRIISLIWQICGCFRSCSWVGGIAGDGQNVFHFQWA